MISTPLTFCPHHYHTLFLPFCPRHTLSSIFPACRNPSSSKKSDHQICMYFLLACINLHTLSSNYKYLFLNTRMYKQNRCYQADSQEMRAFVWHVANSSDADFRKFFGELSLHVLVWRVCAWHYVLQNVAVCCSGCAVAAASNADKCMHSSGTSQLPQIPIFGFISCAISACICVCNVPKSVCKKFEFDTNMWESRCGVFEMSIWVEFHAWKLFELLIVPWGIFESFIF